MAHVDLTDMFGEGWCITLTRRSVLEALAVMGVAPQEQQDVSLDEVTTRLEDLDEDAEQVMLMARPADEDWTLVLELDGSSGWVGSTPEVLAELSENGGMAGSAMALPDEQEIVCAQDGTMVAGIDPVTSRVWGGEIDRFRPALATAGFAVGDDDEGGSELRALPVAQRTIRALEATLGVRLQSSMFDDPWQGGLSDL